MQITGLNIPGISVKFIREWRIININVKNKNWFKFSIILHRFN